MKFALNINYFFLRKIKSIIPIRDAVIPIVMIMISARALYSLKVVKKTSNSDIKRQDNSIKNLSSTSNYLLFCAVVSVSIFVSRFFIFFSNSSFEFLLIILIIAEIKIYNEAVSPKTNINCTNKLIKIIPLKSLQKEFSFEPISNIIFQFVKKSSFIQTHIEIYPERVNAIISKDFKKLKHSSKLFLFTIIYAKELI